MTLREIFGRIAAWRRRHELDRELAGELEAHLDLLARDFEHQGMSPAEARAAARRRLGNATSQREESREAWGFPALTALAQDLRYALRGLRRSPGFTAVVVLTLGLGIGANAAMFNVVDHLMFRPFPYLQDPGTVHRVYLQSTGRAGVLTQPVFPYTRFRDLERWTHSFSQHAAFTTATLGVGSGLAARERTVLGVSAGFFGFFDARPALGRFFVPGEDSIPVGANVAVLGHAFWRTEFGGRDVIGEDLQVGNLPYTIVGVAPAEFIGTAEEGAPAVFVPISAYAANEGGGSRGDYWIRYNWDWAEMIVRTRPGVSREAAMTDLNAAYARSYEASREVHPLYRTAEVARPQALLGRLKTIAGPAPSLEARTLLWVTGVALVVLLVACANVANLFLARAFRRQREIAVRVALGVTRGRLIAQAVTESLVLAVLGAVAGLAIAQWGGLALRRFYLPASSPFDLMGDGRTFVVALLAAVVAAVSTGLVPVLFAGRLDIARMIKEGGREGSGRRSRVRSALLVAQGALCVILLVGAGLFTRSLGKVRDLHLGYDLDRLLIAEWSRRGTPMDVNDRVALRRRMLEAALERPAVEGGSWISSPPFARGTSTLPIAVPGIDSVSALGRFTFQVASAGYFEVSGTRILQGRAFTEDDRPGHPPVAVVSAGMAERIWPGGDAVGQCFRVSWSVAALDTVPCTTVIGVAENAVHDPGADLPLRYYLPEAQHDIGSSTLLLRVRGDPLAASEEVRIALQSVAPGQVHVTVGVARELFEAKRRSWVMGATMFAAFGVLALLVAAVGLYGVIAYNVEQRMHELGVRMALGARAADVRRLVVGQGLRHSLAGVALGVVIAGLAAPWIQPLLFDQPARDPVVFVFVGAVLVGVALVASLVPAEKATRADPNAALRAE